MKPRQFVFISSSWNCNSSISPSWDRRFRATASKISESGWENRKVVFTTNGCFHQCRSSARGKTNASKRSVSQICPLLPPHAAWIPQQETVESRPDAQQHRNALFPPCSPFLSKRGDPSCKLHARRGRNDDYACSRKEMQMINALF